MYPSQYPYNKHGITAGIPAPAPAPPPNANLPSRGLHPVPWSTGLCHCMDDPGNCLMTCLCPCITFGEIADIVDEGSCSCVASGAAYAALCFTGAACFYSYCYRSKLRGRYDIAEGPAPDFLVHCCCEACALCQEHRELRTKGFDMGIGWKANAERQRRGMMMEPVMAAPAMGGGMTR
ncbi:cell number regulator 1-like [Curcuma longa]|uniref:cell number regulator 1-like n=1 Tax=Curcuma longa TaxID=136217 RepID=UPI003D9F00D6